MAKRRRELDSDFEAPEAEERRIVYVDTSLETCLGVAISKSDTLSDLKKKVVLDHLQIYPEYGEIMIDRLKVKRKGKYYPLADGTLVRDVFPLVKTSALFFADTSNIPINYMSPKALEYGESNRLRVELGRTSDENDGILSLEVSKVQPPMISLPHRGDLENCEMMDASKVKSPVEKRSVFQCNGNLVENSSEAESRARKKLKIVLNECINQSQSAEDDHDISHEIDEDNLIVDAVEKVSEGILVYNQLEKPLSGENVEASSLDVVKEIDIHSIYMNLQSHLASDSKKADTLLDNVVDRTIYADKSDNELGQNAQVVNVEGVGVIDIEPSRPVRPVDKSDKTQKRKSGSKKKRKRRDDRRSPGVQDLPHLHQGTDNGQSAVGTCINMGAERDNIESIANPQDGPDNDRRVEGVLLRSGTSENIVAGNSEKEHGQCDRVDCPEFVALKELNLSGTERNSTDQDAYCSKRKLISVPLEESALDSQYQLALDKTKEDLGLHNATLEFLTIESENKLGEVNPAKHLEGVTIMTGTVEGGKSTGRKKKRKKKMKAQIEAEEIQDASNLQRETGKSECVEPNTETFESGNATESVLSLNLDAVMMLPLIKTSDVSPNLMGEEVIAEAKITSRKKKKKKMKRKIPADTNLENDSAVLRCSTYDHSLEETMKGCGVKFSDPSAGDASEQNQNADGNMVVFVAAQTEQTLINGVSEEVMGEKDQCPGVVNSDSTVMVKDNLESNQIDENGMSTKDKRKKSKKKRIKILNAELHVKANLPGKDQKVDDDVFAMKESLTSIKNPEVQQNDLSSPIVVPDIPQENTGLVQTADADDKMDSESVLKGSNIEKMQYNITTQRKADEIHCISNLQQVTGKGEFVELNAETLESGKANENVLSLNLDEVMMLPFIKTSDVLLREVSTGVEIMSGSRKKKKKKMKGKIPANNNLESDKNMADFVTTQTEQTLVNGGSEKNLTSIKNTELQQRDFSSPIVPEKSTGVGYSPQAESSGREKENKYLGLKRTGSNEQKEESGENPNGAESSDVNLEQEFKKLKRTDFNEDGNPIVSPDSSVQKRKPIDLDSMNSDQESRSGLGKTEVLVNSQKLLCRTWTSVGEMRKELEEDIEFCMHAVCVLYRHNISNPGELRHSEAIRVNKLAEYLTNGDPQHRLRRFVSEVKEDYLVSCRQLAMDYSLKLFKIYHTGYDILFKLQ